METRYELRTGGGIDLLNADHERVTKVLSAPKRLALLVFLVVEGMNRPLRRDELCAMFWPESNHRRARRNLRQSLRFLRKALGEGIVVTDVAEEVTIDRERVTWVPGPDNATFLRGFHFDGQSKEWEEWVDRGLRTTPARPAATRETAGPIRHPVAKSKLTTGTPAIRRFLWGAVAGAFVVIIGLGIGFTRRQSSDGRSTGLNQSTMIDGSPPRAQAIRFPDGGTANPKALQLARRQQSLGASQPETNQAGIHLLRRSIALDPDYADALAHLAWRFVWEVRMGRSELIDSAMAYSSRAIELDPQSGTAHMALGSALWADERRAAVRSMRRASEFSPDGGWPQDLSLLLAMTGELEEGLEASVRMYRASPTVGATWHVGILLYLLAEDERTDAWVESAMEQLADLNLGLSRHQLLRLRLLVAKGATSAAIEQARFILERYPHGREAQANAAAVLAFLGEGRLAMPVLARLAESAPDAGVGLFSSTVRTAYAYALLQTGRREEGLGLLDESIAVNRQKIEEGSDLYSRFIELSSIYAFRGNVEGAVQWLERAVDAGFRDYRYAVANRMFDSIRDSPGFGRAIQWMRDDVERMARDAERMGVTAAVDSLLANGLVPSPVSVERPQRQ